MLPMPPVPRDSATWVLLAALMLPFAYNGVAWVAYGPERSISHAMRQWSDVCWPLKWIVGMGMFLLWLHWFVERK